MQLFKLSDSGDRGWFIGDFPNAIYKTSDFELCYKLCPRGHVESHYHKEITEIKQSISALSRKDINELNESIGLLEQQTNQIAVFVQDELNGFGKNSEKVFLGLKYLKEEAEEGAKLKHITHAEDRPLQHGSKGFTHAYNALNQAHDHIKSGGHSSALTMKYDGSPAVVFGHHPDSGK